MNLRQFARNRECQVRLAGICNGDPATTVLAHFRLIGVSGLGTKSPDLIGAWCCYACHQKVDTDKSPQVQLDFAKGVFRTQAALIKAGRVKA